MTAPGSSRMGAPSEEAVEALYDKLAFNEAAYGKAWTGELEDCRFLLSASEEIIREDQTKRIVEALQEATTTRADDDGCLVEMRRFRPEVVDFITERFGGAQ